MKLAVALLALSVVVMAVIIFQAVRQELQLHAMETSRMENFAVVKREEESIIELKKKIHDMKASLVSVTAQIDTLQNSKGDLEAVAQRLHESMQTCITQKADVQKKKSDVGEAIVKLKADHAGVKGKAEEEIQSLKRQILDRDKAICAFADTTKEEARKLCGIPEAPK